MALTVTRGGFILLRNLRRVHLLLLRCGKDGTPCEHQRNPDKKSGPEGAAKSSTAQCTNCRASATSTESPSWFRTSSPDSGTSPDVLCDTMIFLAINPRQVICEELA